MPPTGRSCLIVLADGARAEDFERLLAAGELPSVQRHVVERGSYRRASSVFTSTTGPAHLPFLTGCFPGTAEIPGYRWFDRAAYRRGLPAGPWCLRSYNGPEAFLLDRDLAPGCSTLFELTEGAFQVFGTVTRGVAPANNLFRRRKGPIWMHSHYGHNYVKADEYAARGLLESVQRPSEFRFIVFPGIDWNSHYIGTFSPETTEAFRRVDRAVGEAAAELQRRGLYESTLIMVCSDHGHHPVHTHYDLPVIVDEEFGIRSAFHSRPALRRRFDAVACVSGNGMAQLYLRVGDWRHRPNADEIDASYPGIRERLLAQPAIDLLATRDPEPGWIRVESRRGAARLAERDDGLAYEVVGADPFGWEDMPPRPSAEEALAGSFDTDYPDGLVQIAQLFRSRRCGDLIVSATPGYDLRDRYEKPEHHSSHGSLQTSHMTVPLASSEPLAEGPMRTVDVFATVLSYLGRDSRAGIDARSRFPRDRSEARTPGPASSAATMQ